MRRFVLGFVSVLVLLGVSLGQAPGASAASSAPTDVTVAVDGLNVNVTWTDGDPAGVTGYVVSTSPRSPAVTVPAGATSAVLTGLRPGISYTVSVAAVTSSGTGSAVVAPSAVKAVAPGGSFTGLTPARLLDTRIGLGAPKGATHLAELSTAGRGGVPASGVSAVVLNVTVTGPDAGGYVTAYPAGQSRPQASNVNYTAGRTVANLVVVPVGTGGVVDLYSSARSQLIADVSGYYSTVAAASPAAGLYHPLSPSRLLDTRKGTGGSEPGPGGTVSLQVTGQGPVPASGVSAVVLNTTVTKPTSRGYVTVYPTGAARPSTSSLNFAVGQTIANRVVVPVSKDGKVSLYNSAGHTQLVADVTGWFTDGSDTSAGGSYYVALPPHRLVDTRTGLGAPKSPLGPAGVLPVQVAGEDGVAAATAQTPPTAAVVTVTVVNETAATYASVYPSLAARPGTSDLNAVAREAVPNLALPGLGMDGAVDVYNNAGSADVIVDLSGYFIGDVHTPASTVTAPSGSVTAVSEGASGPSSVTLDAGAPVPKIGQVIASGVTSTTPDGLLAQVTGLTTDQSGNTVAQVQPATLQQALGDATIAISAPLGAEDITSTQTSAGAAPRVRSGVTRHSGMISLSQLRARTSAGSGGTPITASGSQPCSGDAGSKVAFTDSFNPALVFEADLGHKGFTPTVTAKAGIDISEQVGASVTFGGKVSCDWSAKLATYTFKPIVFDVAGVPVVIVPVFTLTMTGTARGSAQLSASVDQTFRAQAGIAYANGSVTPYQSVTNKVTHSGPSVTAAGATASVSLTGDLEGKLYGVAGPEASVTATLSADVDPASTPWWTIGLTVRADAALHIRVLFVHVDASADWTLLSVTVAQASGAATGSPPVITTTSLPGATVGTAYHAELTTADHRTGTWSLAGGSLPAGLSLAGYTVSGTPTAAGTSSFTLKFTDTHGHTVQAPATLTVYPGSGAPATGGITGRVTDSQGNSLADTVVTLMDCYVCTGQSSAETTTAADGTYTFTDLAPSAQYGICFDPTDATGGNSDPTGYVSTCYGQDRDGSGPNTAVSVTAGHTTAGIGAVVIPGGAISGRVTDSSGKPLPAGDAWVAAMDGSMGLVPHRIPGDWVGADGTYLIKGIDQGDVQLCFMGSAVPVYPSFTGYTANCYGGVPMSVFDQSVPVTARETNEGFNGRLGQGAALSGTVTTTGGAALDNVLVTVEGVSATSSTASGYAAESMHTYTDSDGHYAVGNLTPGTNYQVCFEGRDATGAGSAPYGYGRQCYKGVTDESNATLIHETAGQFLTGINGQLTAKTSAADTSAARTGAPNRRDSIVPPSVPNAGLVLPPPEPLARKIKNHVAFWNGVAVEEVAPQLNR